MTHPFHPCFGCEYELVVRRRNWGEDRVYFHDAEGVLRSLPAGWTDADDVDAFVAMAAGRSPFRADDLLELADMVARFRAGQARS